MYSAKLKRNFNKGSIHIWPTQQVQLFCHFYCVYAHKCMHVSAYAVVRTGARTHTLYCDMSSSYIDLDKSQAIQIK